MIKVGQEKLITIKTLLLEPEVYVIKVGKKCFITEKPGEDWHETIYALTDNLGGATFYTSELFDGIKGLKRKAEMLGGELLQVHLSKQGEEEEDGQQL